MIKGLGAGSSLTPSPTDFPASVPNPATPWFMPHAFLISFQTPSSKRQITDNSLWGFFDFWYSSTFLPPSNSWLIWTISKLLKWKKKNRLFRMSHFLSCMLISGVLIVIIFAFKSVRILISQGRWGTMLPSGVGKMKVILRKPLFGLDPDVHWVTNDVTR